MGYPSLPDCVADLQRTGQLCASTTKSIPTSKRPRCSGRLPGSRPGHPLSPRQRCAFPLVSNLFGTLERTRFLFRDTLEAVRHLVAAEGRPRPFLEESLAISRRAPRSLEHEAEVGQGGPGAGSRDELEPAAANRLLARRRRAIHHLAPGLHRRCRSARLAGFESRHVSRSALGQRYQAGSPGRAALSDSSRHRRASCGGTAAGCRFGSMFSWGGRRP